MSIVLRESEWAKQMIDTKTLGKKPAETLTRVARYFLDQGYSQKDVRQKLDTFLYECDESIIVPKWSTRLDKVVSYAVRHPANNIEYIGICQSEIDKIDALTGTQTRRLAFTLLCLSKYYDMVNPNADHWVNDKDNEIMTMACINTSIKRQGMMYRTLRDKGMIQFSRKVDNPNVRVLFGEEGEPVLRITDFRNLGYRYLMYKGEPYFECTNCGVVTKLRDPTNKRRQKYCPECAVKMKVRQNVEAMVRSKKAKTVNRGN